MYQNIELITSENKNYRKVIHTTPQQQLVVMSLNYKEEIPMEKHLDTTQFFRIESGRGYAIVGHSKYRLEPGISLMVPPGKKHYIKQLGYDPLKFYTIYSPPHHPKNKVDKRQPSQD